MAKSYLLFSEITWYKVNGKRGKIGDLTESGLHLGTKLKQVSKKHCLFFDNFFGSHPFSAVPAYLIPPDGIGNIHRLYRIERPAIFGPKVTASAPRAFKALVFLRIHAHHFVNP
jgi:hypothetical protein